MPKCNLHPGRDAVKAVGGKQYCQICINGQTAAASQVAQMNPHVQPKDCFVTFKGGDIWAAIPGTGCAHWVAHQLNISRGAVFNQCLLGRTIRVPDLITGKIKIDVKGVKVNDIWTNTGLNHCGLVAKVEKDKAGVVQIHITHDSSNRGGVFTNDFLTYFHGQGNFYR